MALLRRHEGLLLGAAALAASPGVYLLWRFDPSAADSRFPPCIFHALTGLWCPGCGTTRALHALAHGDVGGALAMNPLLLFSMLAVPAIVAWSRGWRPAWLASTMAVVGAPRFWLLLIPLFTLARNLPWPPFSWLAPG